jgi:hypothetical protein
MCVGNVHLGALQGCSLKVTIGKGAKVGRLIGKNVLVEVRRQMGYVGCKLRAFGCRSELVSKNCVGFGVCSENTVSVQETARAQKRTGSNFLSTFRTHFRKSKNPARRKSLVMILQDHSRCSGAIYFHGIGANVRCPLALPAPVRQLACPVCGIGCYGYVSNAGQVLGCICFCA